jgi:hypothetical protein
MNPFTNVDAGGWVGWLQNAQLAANLVIVAATLSVARVLWGLSATRRRATLPRSPRVLVPFAALIALCGVSHLGLVVAGQTSTPVLPAALKLLAASLWVVTAVRFRATVVRLLTGPLTGPTCRHDGEAPATPCAQDCALHAAAARAERLKVKIRTLEIMILNDTCLLDKTDALRELREILADLEAEPCKI